MKKIPSNIYNQFQLVARQVLTDLKKKGYVVPVPGPNGSLKFEKFTVLKNSNGLYTVRGKSITYFEDINLPQTAAILANNLALGKILDTSIINLDRDYGYRLFEEELYQKAINRPKNSLDQFIMYDTRKRIARAKKQEIKDRILSSFKKLTNIV